MKVYNLPIECIACHSKDGIPKPIRIRLKRENQEDQVIRKVKTQSVEKCRQKGKVYFKYVCQSIVNGMLKVFELQFHVESCQWVLFKI